MIAREALVSRLPRAVPWVCGWSGCPPPGSPMGLGSAAAPLGSYLQSKILNSMCCSELVAADGLSFASAVYRLGFVLFSWGRESLFFPAS